MTIAPAAALCAALLAVPALALAQHKTPTEAQCRQMVEHMLHTMKTVPVEKEKEKREAQAVYERTERTVRENRARGASECDSWAAIGKIVVNQ